MKKTLLFTFALTLFFAAQAFSYANLRYYLNKTEGSAYEVIVVPDVSGASAAEVKGPAMADYEPAPFLSEYSSETWHSGPKTFTELKAFISGKWYVHIYIGNYAESVYSFTIADTLQEPNFLPVPSITEPMQGADDVIAQHCHLTWDSNGADANAQNLWVQTRWYSASLLPSQTSWDHDWLDMGESYCKVWYSISPSGLMGPLQYVSGTSFTWNSSLAYLVSSDRHTFTVKYSLDLNDDNHIDFGDFAIFCEHWLEWGPSGS